MHNFGILFIWALAACILWQGFFAKGQSGYICLIEDPKQNQYDSICLTELSSRLSEVVKAQNEGNKKLERLEVKIEKTQDKLLQEVQSKLEGQHANMEAKLEDSLLAVKTKLEGQQVVLTKLKVSQAKLEGSLLAVQAKLENQLQAVVNQLQAMSNKMDAAKVAVHAITIQSGFELIGTRYFQIVKEEVNWETAERRCREMGGYLASFRNEEESNAIRPRHGDYDYWLGINDQENEGHYVSVASQKPAPFLKWARGEPDDTNHEQNCVYWYNGEMSDIDCKTDAVYFICQADKET
nr:accessory gland protein Acp29AB-like [Drosophila kikkawai]